MTKKAPQSLEMFSGGNDLPIFSGVAQRTTVREFRPEEIVRQPSMFAAVACTVCYGTKKVTRIVKGKPRVIKCMYCT